MNTYCKNEVVSFLKTREAFGGLSNMATGYPIKLYGVQCPSSENLFQALKYPDSPEIQSEILDDQNPMSAKMEAKKLVHRQKIRPDWDEIKLAVMDYCLRAKLKCNFQRFGSLLLSTGDADIVEISSKHDTFWGCIPQGDLLVGHNHLGIQLTNLREELIDDEGGFHDAKLAPPDGVELRLMGRVLGTLDFGIWDEVTLNGVLAAIRTNHTNQLPNSTNGGF